MKVLFSAHNDDETLFAAYTIIREKPLVIIVIDDSRHLKYGITAEDRKQESIEAMKILGAPVAFLGIADNEFTQDGLILRLKNLNPGKVFAPAYYPNGNPEHNIVGFVADYLWRDKVIHYSTYRLDNLIPQGDIEIVPTNEEDKLKQLALMQYGSQLRVNRPHFDAVKGKLEYYTC